MKKSITLIIAVLCLINSLSLSAYGTNSSEYEFELPNGEIVTYYYDADNNPYVLIDGEIVYTIVPSEDSIVSDSKTINYLNSLKASKASRSVPTPGFTFKSWDLDYTKNITLNVSPYYQNTATMWLLGSYPYLYLKTTNIIKTGLSNKITFYYWFYEVSTDTWHSTKYNQTCTGSGFPLCVYPTMYPYSFYSFIYTDTVKSFTATITAAAS